MVFKQAEHLGHREVFKQVFKHCSHSGYIWGSHRAFVLMVTHFVLISGRSVVNTSSADEVITSSADEVFTHRVSPLGAM